MKHKSRSIIRWTALTLAVVLVFSAGYWSGRSGLQVSFQNHRLAVVTAPPEPDDVDFSLFWQAWQLVNANYVKPTNNHDKVYGAIAGMVDSLGDPFSQFMPPTEASQFNDQINGTVSGIGAELTTKNGLVTVVSSLADSPAEKAGLQAGDTINKVNGKDVSTSLDNAIDAIRGNAGTTVTIIITRDSKTQTLKIVRADVNVPSVTYKNDNGYGIITLSQFDANTLSAFDDAVSQSQKDRVKGVVLDLRNDPGGLLDVAVDVAGRFLPSGSSVVIEKDKNGHETTLKTTQPPISVSVPVVVLVNNGSASASEIVAGALQDAARATIVGETTFGKGSVQELLNLKDSSTLRITVAEWLTPKGRAINKIGITPDIVVEQTSTGQQAGLDPQLERALAVLATK